MIWGGMDWKEKPSGKAATNFISAAFAVWKVLRVAPVEELAGLLGFHSTLAATIHLTEASISCPWCVTAVERGEVYDRGVSLGMAVSNGMIMSSAPGFSTVTAPPPSTMTSVLFTIADVSSTVLPDAAEMLSTQHRRRTQLRIAIVARAADHLPPRCRMTFPLSLLLSQKYPWCPGSKAGRTYTLPLPSSNSTSIEALVEAYGFGSNSR
mmetsp:Transcript_5513/g.12651  ORF Transcript_5513/g.12651 Transcript_5513/m.12651 type:complete len:209 (+) Transcript_5513:1153-1779(+)